MYAFCCKQRSLLCNFRSISAISEMGFVLKTRILEIALPIRSFSSERTKSKCPEENGKQPPQEHSFAMSYLIDSCGLSPKAAISASKWVKFESPEKPDSVIGLFKNYGFESVQITKIVTQFPQVLNAKPEKTIAPKLEFFHSVGLSNLEVIKILTSCPNYMKSSLEKKIVPTCNFLKSMVGGDNSRLAAVLGRSRGLADLHVERRIIPNVEFLRGLGASQPMIVSLICLDPTVLNRTTDQFASEVKEVIEMGFNPSQSSFVQALLVTKQYSKLTWQRKLEVYKRLGWSDSDIDAAFRRNPRIVCFSEMKIASMMEFFVNKMGLECAAIARDPFVLHFSLENWIIPRFKFLRLMQLKGFVEKDINIISYIRLSKKLFFQKFVTQISGRHS